MDAPTAAAWTDAHVVRFAQSSFLITTADGTVVGFDLFQPLKTPVKVDWLFYTHDHGDHFNADVARSVLKDGTRVVVPAAMKASGTDAGLATDALEPGETRGLGPFTVTAVPAYNLTRPFHPRAKGWVGYLLALDGVRVYHAGDTDYIPEMAGLGVDLALLPVGGLFTMHWDDALRAAETLGNPVVVPIHYGLIPFTAGKGKRFAKAYGGATRLL